MDGEFGCDQMAVFDTKKIGDLLLCYLYVDIMLNDICCISVCIYVGYKFYGSSSVLGSSTSPGLIKHVDQENLSNDKFRITVSFAKT